MLLRGGGLVSLALFALWLFCIFDVIGTDESACRNLPKTMWLILVLFLPAVGGVAWLIMGRPENVTFTPGSSAYRTAPRGVDGPPSTFQDPLTSDALTDVTRDREERARLRVQAEQLKRREAELQAREDELRRREEG